MNRNYKTAVVLLAGLFGLLFLIGSALGQGGTGRETPKPPPKTVTPAKKTTPKGNTPATRQASCSAQSPTQGTGRTRTVNLSGGVQLELVEIPAGSFCMGSTNGNADERPVHRVTIGNAFYMGKYELTQAQWQAVMGNNPSSNKGCGGTCPVETVSWVDVQEFIQRLNGTNDGYTYRLPTEAEWEYACRAGTTGDYAGDLKQMAWFSENSGNTLHPVGQKQSNAWGLADMHGNVWEWCEDWYHETYYGAPTDGSAWLKGGGSYKVFRGGSWNDPATSLRSSDRKSRDAMIQLTHLSGFRVVAVARTQ